MHKPLRLERDKEPDCIAVFRLNNQWLVTARFRSQIISDTVRAHNAQIAPFSKTSGCIVNIAPPDATKNDNPGSVF